MYEGLDSEEIDGNSTQGT